MTHAVQTTDFPTAVAADFNGQHTCLTPYADNRWESIVKYFNILVPFDRIMDSTEGKSVCQACHQVYAGRQLICTKKVAKFTVKFTQYSHVDNYRGYYNVGDHYSGGWSGGTVIKTFWAKCDGRCVWDHEEKFRKQQEFFNFVSHISGSSITDEAHLSFLQPYENCFRGNTAETIEKRILVEKVMRLERENEQMKQVLKEVVNRMQAAGNCLSVGVF